MSLRQKETKITFEDVIIRLFHRLSVCIAIFGRRGSGKTDLSLYIMEILAREKQIVNFATNIKVSESPFIIQYVTNLEDLEFWAANTRGKKLFVLDEAGKSLRRRTPMSSLNIKFLDELQILRKYSLSMILIAPHEKYMDSASLGSDILDAVIVKPNFKNPKIALYDDLMEDEQFTIVDLPRTSLNFNTWDIAPFKKESSTRIPKFKDKDLEHLWFWSHGKSIKQLGLYPMQINRLSRKFIRETMERDYNTSHLVVCEDIPSDANVMET